MKTPLVVFAATALVLASFMIGCDGEEDAGLPLISTQPYLRPGDRVLADSSKDVGGGAIVVEDIDGRLAVVFALDRSWFHPDSNVVRLDSLARRGPYGGRLVDFECLPVAEARLDSVAWTDPPEPEVPGDYSDDFLAALRRYYMARWAAEKRYLLATEEVSDGDTTTVVRIFDGVGKVLGEHRTPGSFKKALPNQAAGEKTYLLNREGRLRYALFDYVTGQKLGESGPGTDFDEGTDIVDVELFGNRLIILERDRGNTQVRMRVLGLDGVEFYVILIPGDFVRALHDGRNLKFIATRDTTRTPPNFYTDIIDILNGRRLSGPATPTGFASNPIVGDTIHIQVDAVRLMDGTTARRFVAAVRDTTGNDTLVRIADERGNTVGAVALIGRTWPKAGAVRRLGRCKVFAQDVNGNTEVSVLDLETGARKSLTPIPGAFRFSRGSIPGPLSIETDQGSRDVSLAGC